ncbi:hypothetical protein [Rhodococcus sp. HNM0563]|uniref:hypothetical protein n=1 Tax=Rhodococcus sp. HNM0563 TaxID=2716339 RepID=UPI00197F4592|nr:hypothetical protein [Rhodococcus sp. HNM0563]
MLRVPRPQSATSELAQDEDIRGFSDQARLVANNTSVLRRASSSLVDTDVVTVDDVVMLHAATNGIMASGTSRTGSGTRIGIRSKRISPPIA